MATATVGAAAADTMAKNYMEKYTRTPDVLNGSYHGIYTRHSRVLDSAMQLHRHATSSKDVVPKVYLCHTTIGGKPTISAIHRPSVYESHPVNPSQWDEQVFAFRGDLMPGNYITMIQFTETLFDRTTVQTVPTLAAMDGLVASLPADQYYIPAPEPHAADTEEIRTRNVVQVPYPYIPLVLQRQGTPKEYWLELAGAIRNDGREQDLKPVLDWLRVALTQSRDEDDVEPPENCMGERNDIMPALAIDDVELQTHRWDTLCRDLPGLNPPAPVNDTDRVMALVTAMKQESDRERAAAATARTQAAAPKLPSEVFPLVHRRWLAITGVTDPKDLPMIYQQWANGTKGERRPALQTAFDNTRSSVTTCTQPGIYHATARLFYTSPRQ